MVHVDVNNGMDDDYVKNNHMKIKWDELTNESLTSYTTMSKQELSKVTLNHDLLLCDDPKCKNPVHLSAMDRMYNEITTALLDASVGV